MRGLPEHFRARYFDRMGSRWVFTPDLRRTVIFGRNDLTQDAPISRIDLLLCRNTLMYFNAETQARVVSRLGFALRPNGVLFLGKAEMLLNHAAVFDPMDLKRRFFRKSKAEVDQGVLTVPWRIYGRTASTVDGIQFRNQLIMSNPVAQIAVGSDDRLVIVNHRAAAMLGLSDRDVGRPFADLEVSYRPVELRSHVASVMENRTVETLREVAWRRPGAETVYLDIQLVPLIDGTSRAVGVSISFTDVTRHHELQVEVESANRQLETAYEELQSTNEELETMNEELQSANDELQSTNEQLRDQTLAVGEANGFMQAILDSLDTAVIVVDGDLVVQVWSRQAEELWGLRESETVGRHIFNLDSGMPTEQLHGWLRRVVTGQDRGGILPELIPSINRRGRRIQLRMTVTPMTVGASPRGKALVLFEVQPDSSN
jgi:two-component system CheB/CheR fusion protein